MERLLVEMMSSVSSQLRNASEDSFSRCPAPESKLTFQPILEEQLSYPNTLANAPIFFRAKNVFRFMDGCL